MLPPSSMIQLTTFTYLNMLTLSWWAYFLILSVGAGALALALVILFHKYRSVLFSPEVNAKFHHMAESAHVTHHQWLAHQQAQEIARNHRTAPVHQPSIELNTIVTTPTPAHTSDYHTNHTKHQGHIFTPVDFNIGTSSQYYTPHSVDYTILPLHTYSTSTSLHSDSPMLGTNPEIQIHSPTPPTSPTESSPPHPYPHGLHNKPSNLTLASRTTMTSQVTLLLS